MGIRQLQHEVDTITSRVCPTQSPKKGFNDTADAAGAGVLAFVDVLAGVVAAGTGELVTVTVTVLSQVRRPHLAGE